MKLIVSCFFSVAGIMSRAYGGGNAHHRPASFNDLPVPEGDWQEAHQQQQSKYNAQLAGSILLFVGIVAYVRPIVAESILHRLLNHIFITDEAKQRRGLQLVTTKDLRVRPGLIWLRKIII